MLKKLFKIFNWKEYLSLFLTLFFIKYSFLNNFEFKTSLNYPNFFLLVFSSLLIVISGELLAYYYSKKGMAFFKEHKIKVPFIFSLFFLALLISLYVFFKIDKIYYFLIFLFLIIATSFYVFNNYRKTLSNNLIISSYKPVSMMALWYIDFPHAVTFKQWNIILQLEVILLYIMIVSFAANFSKHILIDLKNKKKDTLKNHKTLPIVFGKNKTKKILIYITIATHLLAVFIVSLFLNGIQFNFYLIILLYLHMLAHQTMFIYYLSKAKEKKDYEKMISKITNTLFIGILIFPIMAYFIKNVI